MDAQHIAQYLAMTAHGLLTSRYGVLVEAYHAYCLPDTMAMFAPGRARLETDGNGRTELVFWTYWASARLPMDSTAGDCTGEDTGEVAEARTGGG